jgi:hypothetical protein
LPKYAKTTRLEDAGVEDFPDSEAPVPEIDISKPHPARIYDYTIGGRNHFAADREVADKALASWPTARCRA